MAVHPDIGVGVHGTNLPGAVNSNLTLTGVTFAQAGFYTVSVTNAAGSALSDPAALSVWRAAPPAFSYLTYNVHGNGLTNWSTNMWHVQAIGRQMQYLDPDIITFNEIPVTNNCTAQMADFVTAFRPGYYLVTNSMDDGFIHSVILSRYPIVASRSWLHGAELAPFGYTNTNPAPYFTRDLFEAEISVPGFPQPLHVFTVHLKSGQDADSAAKRAAEAGAVSNFFATVYLPANGQEPYVLSGDMNEDILRPPASDPRSLQRLISAPTGLQHDDAGQSAHRQRTDLVHSGHQRRPDRALRLHPAVRGAVLEHRRQPGFPHGFADPAARQPVQQRRPDCLRPSAGVHGFCQSVQHAVPAACPSA